MFNTVAVLGSRSLPPRFLPAVAAVVASLRSAGCSQFVSCCASGACAAARAAVGPSCRVFSASAFPAASFAGSLARRSSACIQFVASQSGSVVLFLGSPSSVGSIREARLAAGLSVPVFVFCCGFPASLLPSLGAGSWLPAAALPGAFLWSPAATQSALF